MGKAAWYCFRAHRSSGGVIFRRLFAPSSTGRWRISPPARQAGAVHGRVDGLDHSAGPRRSLGTQYSRSRAGRRSSSRPGDGLRLRFATPVLTLRPLPADGGTALLAVYATNLDPRGHLGVRAELDAFLAAHGFTEDQIRRLPAGDGFERITEARFEWALEILRRAGPAGMLRWPSTDAGGKQPMSDQGVPKFHDTASSEEAVVVGIPTAPYTRRSEEEYGRARPSRGHRRG